MTDLECELLAALQDARTAVGLVVEGGYMARATPWRDDGKLSKHDRCEHGRWMYEGCENCVDATLDPALARIDAAIAAAQGTSPGTAETGTGSGA